MSCTQLNLDRLAAEHAQAIVRKAVDEESRTDESQDKAKRKTKKQLANDIENTLAKALGVLQEDGVYACFLYLLAKEKENGAVVVGEMLNLLDRLGFGWSKPDGNSPGEVLTHISVKVTTDLERLLLVKETFQQMLIYARYGAKALG